MLSVAGAEGGGWGAPLRASARERIPPLVLSAQNFDFQNIPATKNLALTCGVWWAGSVQAIKADPAALLAPE